MKVNESALMHEVVMNTASCLSDIEKETDFCKARAIANKGIGYIEAIGEVLDCSDAPDTGERDPYDMMILELLRCKKDIYYRFGRWMDKRNEWSKDPERLEVYAKAGKLRDEMWEMIHEREQENHLAL